MSAYLLRSNPQTNIFPLFSREIRYITNQSDEKCRKECKFIQDRNSEAYRDACSRIASTLPGKQITSSQPPYPNHTIQDTEASSPIHSAVNPETQDTSSRPSTRPSPRPLSRKSKSYFRSNSGLDGSRSGSSFGALSTTAIAGSQASILTRNRRSSGSYDSDAASTKALYNVSL